MKKRVLIIHFNKSTACQHRGLRQTSAPLYGTNLQRHPAMHCIAGIKCVQVHIVGSIPCRSWKKYSKGSNTTNTLFCICASKVKIICRVELISIIFLNTGFVYEVIIYFVCKILNLLHTHSPTMYCMLGIMWRHQTICSNKNDIPTW